ncbi:MAG: MFS transporter [Alphaproteobacteria bacterium]|nr:MFS transporter [Alphaproteobacteria bacterium]
MTRGDHSAALPAPAKPRAIIAVTIGNAVEFYDFLIYSLFAIQIGAALFPPMAAGGNLVAALGGFGIGFLARPVGAWVIGRWSDRHGRKPAMVASMLLIGVANAGLAFIPDFASIGWEATALAILCRLLAGFALGGELGSNSAYLAEASPPDTRALTVSWQGTSQMLAFLAASVMGWGLAQAMTPADFAAYGWRIAVMSGLVAIPVALWLRAGLEEPPAMAHDHVAADLPDGGRRRLLIGCFVLLATSTIINYIAGYTATLAQDTLKLSAQLGFAATAAGYGMGAVAVVAGGWWADRWGRRPLLLLGGAMLAVATWPCYAIILGWPDGSGLVLGTMLIAIPQNLFVGPLYVAMTEGMPRAWRGAGFGLLYAVAIGIFGGATQPLLAWALHRWPDPWLLAWLMFGLALVQVAAAFAMPETRPRR